jgi:hypothetical protein
MIIHQEDLGPLLFGWEAHGHLSYLPSRAKKGNEKMASRGFGSCVTGLHLFAVKDQNERVG